MKNKTAIEADEEQFEALASVDTARPILGQFEGECADSNITNENGLDITREVWENVFSSDIYHKAIENGWYIGFLGHPEDPNCMDFEHACIKMREGHIADDGKVYGKFDLVDTPVGRIVKAFIDAGVTFGISVRGAGDIINNSVDPETFIFRGFDLVTFPAFPESIPTFSEIAASSDVEAQKKYKAVCAAVRKNIDSLNTKESIDVVQSCFAKQSAEYKMLESQRDRISSATQTEAEEDIRDVQLRGMTDLYLKTVEANEQLQKDLTAIRSQAVADNKRFDRKFRTMKRILSAQMVDMEADLKAAENKNMTQRAANNKLKASLTASKDINLKYKQKIDGFTDQLATSKSKLSEVQKKLDETVIKASTSASRSSNLDAENSRLTSELAAAQSLIQHYQDAYAQLYASTRGVRLENVTVTASTSVEALQRSIDQAARASACATNCVRGPELDIVSSDTSDSDLVTC